MSLPSVNRQRTVGVFLRRNQSDLALIFLRLGIHDLEDALRTGQSGQHSGHLHGDLVDRLGNLLVIVEVGD